MRRSREMWGPRMKSQGSPGYRLEKWEAASRENRARLADEAEETQQCVVSWKPAEEKCFKEMRGINCQVLLNRTRKIEDHKGEQWGDRGAAVLFNNSLWFSSLFTLLLCPSFLFHAVSMVRQDSRDIPIYLSLCPQKEGADIYRYPLILVLPFYSRIFSWVHSQPTKDYYFSVSCLWYGHVIKLYPVQFEQKLHAPFGSNT